jgi:hypothetical protein
MSLVAAVDVMKVGATVQVRNTKVVMYKFWMCLAMDWGGTVKAAESLGHVSPSVFDLYIQIGKSNLAISIKKVEH